MKFIGTNGIIFQRLCVLSDKHVNTRNDCLMDFKDYIIDVTASLASAGIQYISDQRWLNLGYPLDPS